MVSQIQVDIRCNRSQFGVVLLTKGHLEMSGDIFGQRGIHYWHRRDRDKNTAKHSITHRTDPTVKTYLTQNIHSAREILI